MEQRGRKSAAALAIAPMVEVQPRLPPPRSLTPQQKAAWVAVVNARPADWFGPEHEGMLTQYCRHRVQADVVAEQLDSFDPQWLADDDGVKRYDRLAAMMERETRAMNALLRSMRITQQSLVRADKAVPKSAGRKPWQFEGK